MCGFVNFGDGEFIFFFRYLFNGFCCISVSSMSMNCYFICYNKCWVKINIKLVDKLRVFGVVVRKFVKEVFSIRFCDGI